MYQIAVLFCLSVFFSFSQELSLLTDVNTVYNESSGLLYLEGRLISINDSGNAPVLYEMDTLTGGVSRTVVVGNALNTDWEDICADENYIYLADIGNNNGSRTDLKFYRVSIADYLIGTDSVQAEEIHFSYEDQVDFTPSGYSTNFDAEASIVYNDSLYVFTKNWGDHHSNVYVLPAVPGTHVAEKIYAFDAQGLITGAEYDKESEVIMLTGYFFNAAFVLELPADFRTNPDIKRYSLQPPQGYSIQFEAIAGNSRRYFLTAEEGPGGDAGLYVLQFGDQLGTNEWLERENLMFPNPATSYIEILTVQINSVVSIFSEEGRLVWHCEDLNTKKFSLDISIWKRGMYTIIINNGSGESKQQFILQ